MDSKFVVIICKGSSEDSTFFFLRHSDVDLTEKVVWLRLVFSLSTGVLISP